VNPVPIIARKRDGQPLSAEQIAEFIGGYARGEIPDYQMAALAMAIYLNGMTTAETAALVQEMLHSGARLSWDGGIQVDKHSTGGIGDKTSLILAPLLACCGLQVPMLSGRGLGASGGTLDKLESIPGFRADLSLEEIRRQVEQIGCVITGTTAELAPADRKLYALRDVTATVPSIPLITASIMCKKLAEGLRALVLDVKWGSGAFMKSPDQADTLARAMVGVGQSMGVATTALITDMNQPLGRLAGNAVEVDESLDCLRGAGPADLRRLTLALGAELLVVTAQEPHLQAAEQRLAAVLDSGQALERFERMVAAQGGQLAAPRPRAPEHLVHADRGGYLTAIDTEALGWTIIDLGGGRRRIEDRLDFGVGLELLVRLGEPVEAGQPLVRLFARSPHAVQAERSIQQALVVSESPIVPPPLIAQRIATP
jgi:pyrimidine-nucleoside phosphorylase